MRGFIKAKKAYNMLIFLQDLGEKTWAYNLCVGTALEMSGYRKLLDFEQICICF